MLFASFVLHKTEIELLITVFYSFIHFCCGWERRCARGKVCFEIFLFFFLLLNSRKPFKINILNDINKLLNQKKQQYSTAQAQTNLDCLICSFLNYHFRKEYSELVSSLSKRPREKPKKDIITRGSYVQITHQFIHSN